jgi:uncharacterized protein involved in copper resistance
LRTPTLVDALEAPEWEGTIVTAKAATTWVGTDHGKLPLNEHQRREDQQACVGAVAVIFLVALTLSPLPFLSLFVVPVLIVVWQNLRKKRWWFGGGE